MHVQRLACTLLLPGLGLSALALHAPAGSGAELVPAPNDDVVYIDFAYATSATQPGPFARPAAEGSTDVLIVQATRGGFGGSSQLAALEGDVRIGYELQGSATEGTDYKLVDEDGQRLHGWLTLRAGKSQARLTGRFRIDAEVDDWEEVRITLQSVEPGEEADVQTRVELGQNRTLRWIVREDTGPVIQFSHTTPGTFPHPSAKVVAADNVDYWGLRLTDSRTRTAPGTIAGGPVTFKEPLELTFRVSGTALRGMAPGVGVDYVLYDNAPQPPSPPVIPVQFSTRPGERTERARRPTRAPAPEVPAGGPGHVALESGTSTVTLVMNAGASGWAVWAEFFPDEDEGFETVELQLVEARLATSGEPVTIGWNDRASWFKED